VTGASSTGLAPDPVLPHRDALLEAGGPAGRLPALLGLPAPPAGAGRVEIVRAKYRIGESLRVTYRLPAGAAGRRDRRRDRRADDMLVSARMFRPGRLDAEVERAVARGCAPVAVPALETVLWTFPDDRRLSGLDVLTDPPDHARAGVAGWSSSRLLAYAPEKAATVVCLDAAGRPVAFAKVYAGNAAARAHEILRVAHAHAGPALTVPAAVGHLEQHRMTLQSVAPGTPLAVLPAPSWPAPMRALGRALAAVHALPAGHLGPFARLGTRRVERSAELVAAAVPAVADDVTRLAADLIAAAPGCRADGPVVHLHGDVHPRNVLVHAEGDAVSLVDLDQAGTGTPAADLAAMVARLLHPRPGGPSPAVGAAAADELLGGYAAAAPWGAPDPADLAWHVAAVLLVERALRHVNCVDVAGIAELPAVLATARAWLRRATSPPARPTLVEVSR